MTKNLELDNMLTKSKSKKWAIQLKSNFPEKDKFDGIVLHFTDEFILLHEIVDFNFNGIIALNRKKIKGFRDNEFEEFENKIIRENESLKRLSKVKWINKVLTFKELIIEIKKRKIWPIVEIRNKKSKWILYRSNNSL